jgi:hypothetical protein
VYSRSWCTASRKEAAQVKELVQYWQTKYDWRKAEEKLNALPQFVTTIGGVDIHFIHVKSRHPNALPLIMTVETRFDALRVIAHSPIDN